MPLAGHLGLRGGHGSPERTGQSLHLTQEVEGHRTEANLRAPTGTYLHPQAGCSSPAARCPQLVPEDRLACSWSLFPGGQPQGFALLRQHPAMGPERVLSGTRGVARWQVPGPGTERGVPRKANSARLEPAEPLGEDVRVPMEGPRGRAGAP